jgi:hypothetical protein
MIETMIETIWRLYKEGKLRAEGVQRAVADRLITQEQAAQILGQEG